MLYTSLYYIQYIVIRYNTKKYNHNNSKIYTVRNDAIHYPMLTNISLQCLHGMPTIFHITRYIMYYTTVPTTLHCTTINYVILHQITVCYIRLHCTAPDYTTPYYASLHYTTESITLHYTSLHYRLYTVLHYTTLTTTLH